MRNIPIEKKNVLNEVGVDWTIELASNQWDISIACKTRDNREFMIEHCAEYMKFTVTSKVTIYFKQSEKMF